MIAHADALDWLADAEPARLILTDAPHLDTFGSVAEHRTFVEEWVGRARLALQFGGVLLHSCGEQVEELKNYITAFGIDRILIYKHEAGFHYYLAHYDWRAPHTWTGSAVIEAKKPFYFWQGFIVALSDPGDLVVDPFAGRGEVPNAARMLGRRWAGCEIDAERYAACVEQGL